MRVNQARADRLMTDYTPKNIAAQLQISLPLVRQHNFFKFPVRRVAERLRRTNSGLRYNV